MIAIFLLGQIFLFFGGWITFSLLKNKRLFLTPWGFVVSGWYFYLLIYYGPTSISAVLAAENGESSSMQPWFLNSNSFSLSLWAGLVQQLLPLIITKCLLILSTKGKSSFNPWSRLEPLLMHPASFTFGIIGTCIQFIMSVFYAPLWIRGDFVFAAFTPVEKIIATIFLIFTFGPQIALVLFQITKNEMPGNIKKNMLDVIVFSSLILGIIAFSRFSMRTYAMTDSIILLLWIFYRFRVKSAILVFLLPALLVASYILATIYSQRGVDGTLSNRTTQTLSILQSDLSYRSGFGTDSVVIGARQCISGKLDSQSSSDLILNEFISGFPLQIRHRLSPTFHEQKLEVLVGDCYKEWLGRQDIRVDLLDTKAEYFLAAFGPFLGGPIAVFSWLFLELFVMMTFVYFFRMGIELISFMVPAFSQIVFFASTPAEFIVFYKAALPSIIFLYLIFRLPKLWTRITGLV